jgi:hypothetical protein
MIIGLQIIAILFSFSMIYFAVLSYKKKELNGMEVISWLILWVFAIIVVVFPQLLRVFSTTFLVTRVFDLMVIGGFVLVISMVASAYIRTKRLEKKLEDLVRREALGKSKIKNQNAK